MGKEKSHIDFDLVVKYLSNEAEPSEQRDIELWINESDENKAEFKKLQILWSKSGNYKEIEPAKVDPLRAWDKLKNRIDEDKTIVVPIEQEKIPSKNIFFYFTGVAAAILVLLLTIYIFRVGRDVEPTILQAETSIVQDTLSDGTTVALNIGTTLAFEPTSEKRIAKLEGEAFFVVEKDESKPFIIETDEALIKVVGTSFNLQAQPELDTLLLSMETGLAILMNKSATDSLLVSAGQKAFYAKLSGTMGLIEEISSNDGFWLTKTLIFKKTDLTQVFTTLEKAFKVSISVENPDILLCRLSARYKDATLENILQQIAAVFDLEVSVIDNEYIIDGKGCD